jgi:membrane protease YdiL (CAAX protease family)
METEIIEDNNKSHQQVTGIILILLLLLRIPFVIAIIYLMPIDNESGATFYEVTTYLLIALLIWWERSKLSDFHIDTWALAFIIFFRPLQTLILSYWHVDNPLTFPRPFGILLWLISIGLVVALWLSGFKPAPFSSSTLGWFAIGLLAGLLISVSGNLIPFQSALKNIHARQVNLIPVFTSTGINILYHLGFAPVNEEPLFRGFLWGYLRRYNWKEVWIWLFQAGLFTLAHVYYANRYPLNFWLFIPGAALVLGLMTWRSRTIAPGILTHALINASVYMVVFGLFTLFL